MARIFIDGFEGGDLSLWDQKIGNGTMETSTKRSGAYSVRFSQRGNYLVKNLPSTISTVYFKFHFCMSARPVAATHAIFSIHNASGCQACLLMTSDGKLNAVRGNAGGSILATGATALNTWTWYLIEGKITISDTVGVFQVRLNSVTPLEIDVSGVDTQNMADSNITRVMIGTDYGTSNGIMYLYYDNFVLDDAELPGDTIIGIAKINEAGNSTQWTPSNGSNYACVDEVPPAEADYNLVNANDQLDLFGTDLGLSAAEIKCVQVQAKAYKQGSPTPTHLKLAVRTHDTDYVSADKTPQGTFATSLWNLWATNPNTSASWTNEEVNGMEIGYKSAA